MRVRSKTGRIYEYDYSIPRVNRKPSVHHPDFKYKEPHEPYTYEALRRANYQCEICATTNKRLYVHHRDDLGESKTKTPNNDHANLLVLCAKCHMRLHKIGVFPDVKVISRLRAQGHTLEQIGEVFGVSRQRIHQLLQKYILGSG